MTAKIDPKTVAHPLPADLASVSLVTAATSAATGEVSVSWWLDEVRTGRAPKPAIQQPRFTRWTLASVRAFWIARAEQAANNTQAAERMKAQAAKASAAARVKARANQTAQ